MSVDRYAHLVAQGKIKLKPFTTADVHRMPRHPVPETVDPLALLLAERAVGDRRCPDTYDCDQARRL